MELILNYGLGNKNAEIHPCNQAIVLQNQLGKQSFANYWKVALRNLLNQFTLPKSIFKIFSLIILLT